MYTHCYKLNNSHMVYVPNMRTKKSQSKTDVSLSKKSNIEKRKKLVEKTLLASLPARTLVQHKVFGKGEVISTDVYGIMSVAFAHKTARFVYPDAFKDGFLVRV